MRPPVLLQGEFSLSLFSLGLFFSFPQPLRHFSLSELMEALSGGSTSRSLCRRSARGGGGKLTQGGPQGS